MTTVLNGLLGGGIVALLATVATRFVGERGVLGGEIPGVDGGDRLASSPWASTLLLLIYGSVLGGALVALELYVLGMLGVPPTLVEALVVTIPWSAIVFGVLVVLWRFGLRIPLDRSRLGKLLVFHLVYGPGLGAWIRLTWIT
jgi:hypothetical protein